MKNQVLSLGCFLLMALVLFAPGAQALTVTAGWTDSDIGIDERGNGFYAGMQESWSLGSGLFDFTAAGEYVQKVGSMNRFYSHPELGLFEDEAKVRLHCLQPAAFVGLRLPVSSLAPRIYTGVSVVLKLNESWDEPEGNTAGDYGYENMDFQIHVGVSMQVSRFVLDARYSQGMMGQVIDRTDQHLYPTKAEVIPTPENGAKIDSIQIGIGYTF